MHENISLLSADQQYEIPLLEFIAGWAAMFHDSLFDDIDDGADAAWRGQTLPLAAWPANKSGRVVLESVEMLCRILCDTMDWTLRDDPGFCQRNAGALIVENSESAKLNETALERWEKTDRQQRDALLRRIDGRVFAVLVTSGNSLD